MGLFRRIENGTTTVKDSKTVKYLVFMAFIVGILLSFLIK